MSYLLVIKQYTAFSFISNQLQGNRRSCLKWAVNELRLDSYICYMIDSQYGEDRGEFGLLIANPVISKLHIPVYD